MYQTTYSYEAWPDVVTYLHDVICLNQANQHIYHQRKLAPTILDCKTVLEDCDPPLV